MVEKFIDYELIINRIKSDEVFVCVKNAYVTNWKISGAIGKLKTIAWFVAPHFPILIYGIWLIHAEQYFYLLSLPIIYFMMLSATSGVNLISIAPIILSLVITVIIDMYFQTRTIFISVVSILAYVLAVMSLVNSIGNVIDKATSSSKLFQKLYEDETIEIYEKSF